MTKDEIREQLVELLGTYCDYAGMVAVHDDSCEVLADHLLANGVTVKKFDPVNKCGTCAYYERIGERTSGYCLKKRYGSDVACDPKHPYPTVPRSKVKCRHYKEAE